VYFDGKHSNRSVWERFCGSVHEDRGQKVCTNPYWNLPSISDNTYPHFRCEVAPRLHHRQGNDDTCTFSSLASAFHHTGIPELVKVGIMLQNKSNRHCGGTKSLHIAKEIVTDNVNWLQAKNDINDYMFVVGVIVDSTNCQEHAVTILRNWIYNSNEPYALPLSKESLDSCTWEVKDGVINEASLFVRFGDGWIFQERVTKKHKKLDLCVHPP
jgi:hypothetical protein